MPTEDTDDTESGSRVRSTRAGVGDPGDTKDAAGALCYRVSSGISTMARCVASGIEVHGIALLDV